MEAGVIQEKYERRGLSKCLVCALVWMCVCVDTNHRLSPKIYLFNTDPRGIMKALERTTVWAHPHPTQVTTGSARDGFPQWHTL